MYILSYYSKWVDP